MSQGQPRRDPQRWDRDQGAGASGGQDRVGGHVATWTDKITIGEALETAGRTAADKPVDSADAVAIAAAEVTASGLSFVLPGGVAAAAQLASDTNMWATQDEQKAKLGDILGDAMWRMPADKEVTREDAVWVASAEIGAAPELEKRPDGVASTVTAAAKLNEEYM